VGEREAGKLSTKGLKDRVGSRMCDTPMRRRSFESEGMFCSVLLCALSHSVLLCRRIEEVAFYLTEHLVCVGEREYLLPPPS
jgi:hypothetical protein